MRTIQECECKQCGYKWLPRSERTPAVCPKCKRYDWNIDKSKGYAEKLERVQKVLTKGG